MADKDDLSSSLRCCDACKKPPIGDKKLLACTKCRKVSYHDVACQRKHWKQHKRNCRQLAASYTEGVRVVDSGVDEGLGRVVVAAKSFETGDIVLAEPPALVVSQTNGCFDLWNSFLDAPVKTKEGILEMHHTPFEDWERDPRRQMMLDELRRYRQSGVPASRLSDEVAMNLITIVSLNAHAYAAVTGGMVATPDSRPDESLSALFLLSSKFQHSCAPNVSFATAETTGVLQHVAEMPIQNGDRLASCYCSGVYEQPRDERREFLQSTKSFLCECPRCEGADECVPLRCDQCDTGILFRNGDAKTWSCVLCDWQAVSSENIISQLRKQEKLRQEMDNVQEGLQRRGFNEQTLDDGKAVQAKIAAELHPLHWLHVSCWDLLASLAASHARLLMKNRRISPTSPPVVAALRMAGICQLYRMLWVQRSINAVHQRVTLKETVVALQEHTTEVANKQVTEEDVRSVLEEVLASDDEQDHSDLAHIAYHAGRDLLLAGDVDLVVKLYTRFQALFPRWKRLSEEDAQKIVALVESNGRVNRFNNHLVF